MYYCLQFPITVDGEIGKYFLNSKFSLLPRISLYIGMFTTYSVSVMPTYNIWLTWMNAHPIKILMFSSICTSEWSPSSTASVMLCIEEYLVGIIPVSKFMRSIYFWESKTEFQDSISFKWVKKIRKVYHATNYNAITYCARGGEM